MERKTIVRRLLIGYLLTLTLLWLWRDALALPVTTDGMLACLGFPAGLILLVIPNDRTSADGLKGVGLGYATLMAGLAIILLISLMSRISRTSFRGTELDPLPGRLMCCFVSWAILFMALIFISSLEGGNGQKVEQSTQDDAAPPKMSAS
jgi:hypothetical protein